MSTEIQTQGLTAQQSAAWLGLASAKNELCDRLARAELQAQAILTPLADSSDYKAIDEALATYKKMHASMVALRIGLTSKVEDGVIKPLMAYEKRVDPKNNEACKKMVEKSLSLRTADRLKCEMENSKAAEIASFKNHVTNQYLEAAQSYRQQLHKEITAHYAAALLANNAKCKDELMSVISNIRPQPLSKFVPKFLTREEMKDLFLLEKAPDYNSILLEMGEYIEAVFSNFESDVANAAAAISQREAADKLLAIKEDEKLKASQAINTLISKSSATFIVGPDIKKNLVVKVVDSEEWAKAVIAEFVTNMPYLGKYIRVKTWSSLSIGQMAEYLGKYATAEGVVLKNLEMVEVLK